MTARQTVMLLVALVLSMPSLIHSFKPLFSSRSFTHRDITQTAILRKTAEVCRDIAKSKGLDFTLTVSSRATLKKNNYENSDAFKCVLYLKLTKEHALFTF